LSYLGLLGFVYFVLSHFVLKEIRFDFIGNRMDYFLPTNESKSHTMIILLQSYMMIIHMNFIYFLDKWFDGSLLSFSLVLFIIIFQFILITISLRIMSKYPSSANVAFYVSANLMIIKILVDRILQNYNIYKRNQSFSLRTQYFSNKLISFSLCLFVICILDGSVAYASDDECASPVVEGASAGRVLRTGGTFAGAAGGYEMVSIGREAWENWWEASEQAQVLNEKIEECIAAKSTLNNIDHKLTNEYNLIREVDIYVNSVQEGAPNASVEQLKTYNDTIVSYTIQLKANYETYEQFKSHLTDQVYRRLFGTSNCCCGNRTVKES
jgi:hypothetical protein